MGTAFDRLAHEHDTIRPKVEAIRRAAEAVDTETAATLAHRVAETNAFLHGELLPHVAVEEAVLYPTIQRVMGSPAATLGMEHDHVQIRALAAELASSGKDLAGLAAVPPELAQRLRRGLYSLYAVLANHLEKEELVYLPRLRNDLPEAEAADLVDRMAAFHAGRSPDLDAADGG